MPHTTSPPHKQHREHGDNSDQEDQQQQQPDDGLVEPQDAPAANGKRAPRAPSMRSKRPKLTVATLRQPEGLMDVFSNFPKYFANGFGGRGNEVRGGCGVVRIQKAAGCCWLSRRRFFCSVHGQM